jgi:hypothetical protein
MAFEALDSCRGAWQRSKQNSKRILVRVVKLRNEVASGCCTRCCDVALQWKASQHTHQQAFMSGNGR